MWHNPSLWSDWAWFLLLWLGRAAAAVALGLGVYGLLFAPTQWRLVRNKARLLKLAWQYRRRYEAGEMGPDDLLLLDREGLPVVIRDARQWVAAKAMLPEPEKEETVDVARVP